MKKVISRLFPIKTTEVKQHNINVAVAALMIEVLTADQQIDQRETEHSLKLLSDRYDLDQEALQKCYNTAQSEHQSAIDLHQFTKQICTKFDHSERLNLLTELWQIALIDDDLDRHERHTIRKIAALLHLNDKEIIQTLERAKTLVNANK